MAQPKVVIIGAGFAGLAAARRLAGSQVRVQLIDRNNYHVFTPLLYQVATALLDPSSIAQPVRAILRGFPNADFSMASVEEMDLDRCQLLTNHGLVSYDMAIVAVGSENNYFGLEEHQPSV